MNATVQRWGNSHGIRIPKALIKRLGMTIGSEFRLELSEEHQTITLRPASDQRPVRGRHRIEDLIASGEATDNASAELEWGEPKGQEVW